MPEARDTSTRSFPLDYMDRCCLAAMSETHGCSNSPTWELAVVGDLTPDVCRRAIAMLVRRHPTCASLVRPRENGEKPVRHRYEVQPDPQIDELFAYVDLRGEAPETLDKLRLDIRDRTLDPFERFPLHVTLAQTGDRAAILFFQQHHALCDGRAFIKLLADFVAFADHCGAGTPLPPDQLDEYPRRDELSALEIGRARALVWGVAGFFAWLRFAIRMRGAPLTRLLENGRDFRGRNGMLHLTLDKSCLAAWRPLRARAGVGLTAFLAAALFVASRRVNVANGVAPGRTRISIVAETRPRHGRFASFANHLGGLMADCALDTEPDPVAITRAVHEQITAQVATDTFKKRLVLERAITGGLPLATMRKALFEADTLVGNLNLSNLISLRFDKLEASAFAVESIEITTPVIPPYGVMLTVIDYAGALRFNLNYKASIVSDVLARALLDGFRAALDDVAEALSRLPEPEAAPAPRGPSP